MDLRCVGVVNEDIYYYLLYLYIYIFIWTLMRTYFFETMFSLSTFF